MEISVIALIVSIGAFLFAGGNFLCTLIFGILNAANNQAKK